MTELARRFRESVGSAAPADLEARIERWLHEAARAHPSFPVPPEAFIAHVAARVAAAEDPAAAIDGLCVADLYFAFACAMGVDAAIVAFDREVLPALSGYIGRVDPTPDFVAEVRQALRVKLLARDGARPAGIADYGGRAPIATWLRVVVVRVARDLLKKDARYVPLPPEGAAAAPSTARDPEGEYVRAESAAQLNRAFERTIHGLDDRDRALLRLYFVEGMSLAAVGRMYHVHESTILRRINALRERLLEAVKDELELNSSELASNMALVRSRLDFHLSHGLKRTSPPRA
jgi:RNA polymerase sigma-70 factor, ECF subfamily